MHKNVKKLLSVSLALTIFASNLGMEFSNALGSECSSGQCSWVPKKPEEKAVDMESLRIRVVDIAGKPVKEAVFTLQDYMSANTEDYKTDKDGICRINIQGINDSQYTLRFSDPKYSHLVDKSLPTSKREYKFNKSGDDIKFDGTVFDGKIRTVYLDTTVEEENTFKEVDSENIRYKIVDSTGNPVSGVQYIMKAFDNNEEVPYTSDKNGMIIIPIEKLENKPYKFKLKNESKSYKVELGRESYTISNNSTPVSISGRPYDGKIINITLGENSSTSSSEEKPVEGKDTKPSPEVTSGKEKGNLKNLSFKIVDENKKPIKGIDVNIIDNISPKTIIGKFKSDENGIVNITNPENFGIYSINIVPNAKYEKDINGKNSYSVMLDMNKNWNTIDGKKYDGNQLVITLKEKVDSEQSVPVAKKDKIRVKAVDQNGQPVEGIGFNLLDMQSGSDSVASYETDKSGYFTVLKPRYSGNYKLEISNRGKYDPKIPNKFHYILICDENEWNKVESKKFNGSDLIVELIETKNSDKPVTPDLPSERPKPDKPKDSQKTDEPKGNPIKENKFEKIDIKFVDENNNPISGAKIDYIDVDNNDKVLKTLVTGENGYCKVGKPEHSGKFLLSVKKPYKDFMFMDNSRSVYELMSNGGKQWTKVDDKKYDGGEIVIKVKDVDAPAPKSDTIFLRAVDEQGNPVKDCSFSVMDMESFTPLKNTYKTDENGIVSIKVQRKELNFAIIKLDDNNKKYELVKGTIPFTVDRTTIKNVNKKAYDGKPITVELKKRFWKTSITPIYFEMPDDNTIEATFKENIELLEKNPEKLRQLLYLNEFTWKQSGKEKVIFSDKDKISVSGNKITVKLEKPIDLANGSSLVIKEGALSTVDGGVAKKLEWAISTSPRIYETRYENNLYDYNGGQAIVHIKGNRLQELKKGDLKVNVSIGGKTKPLDIPIDIEYGKEPVAKFTLPENKTDKTITYLFSASVKGQADYANITEYGELTAASVLPKGKNKTDQTLGAIRASANDYEKNNEDCTDITVFVKKGEGGLKSMLHLYGTNLDSKITEVRAIDENGVVFPVNHVST